MLINAELNMASLLRLPQYSILSFSLSNSPQSPHPARPLTLNSQWRFLEPQLSLQCSLALPQLPFTFPSTVTTVYRYTETHSSCIEFCTTPLAASKPYRSSSSDSLPFSLPHTILPYFLYTLRQSIPVYNVISEALYQYNQQS